MCQNEQIRIAGAPNRAPDRVVPMHTLCMRSSMDGWTGHVEIELAWSIFASPDSLAPFECHTNFPFIYILTAHLF